MGRVPLYRNLLRGSEKICCGMCYRLSCGESRTHLPWGSTGRSSTGRNGKYIHKTTTRCTHTSVWVLLPFTHVYTYLGLSNSSPPENKLWAVIICWWVEDDGPQFVSTLS